MSFFGLMEFDIQPIKYEKIESQPECCVRLASSSLQLVSVERYGTMK